MTKILKNQLIRERALLRMIPVSRSTLFRWERDGKFPPRMKIGPKTVAWPLSAVQDWIDARAAKAAIRQATSNNDDRDGE